MSDRKKSSVAQDKKIHQAKSYHKAILSLVSFYSHPQSMTKISHIDSIFSLCLISKFFSFITLSSLVYDISRERRWVRTVDFFRHRHHVNVNNKSFKIVASSFVVACETESEKELEKNNKKEVRKKKMIYDQMEVKWQN